MLNQKKQYIQRDEHIKRKMIILSFFLHWDSISSSTTSRGNVPITPHARHSLSVRNLGLQFPPKRGQ